MKTSASHSSVPDTDLLGQALKRQADLHVPPFSPQLHARIMARIDQAQPAPALHPRRVLLLRPALMLAAAAVLIALTLWLLNLPHRAPNPVVLNPAPKSITPPIDLVAATAVTAQEGLDQSRYGYLDRDAQSLAYYVIDQFDLPSAKP